MIEKDVLISRLEAIQNDVERILRLPKKEQAHLAKAIGRRIERLIRDVEEK